MIIELYGRLCNGRRVFVLEVPEVFVVHGRKSVPELLWVPGDMVVTSNADDQEAYHPYCELPDRLVFLSRQSEFTEALWNSCKILDPCVAFTTWRDWLDGFEMCDRYHKALNSEKDPGEELWTSSKRSIDVYGGKGGSGKRDLPKKFDPKCVRLRFADCEPHISSGDNQENDGENRSKRQENVQPMQGARIRTVGR